MNGLLKQEFKRWQNHFVTFLIVKILCLEHETRREATVVLTGLNTPRMLKDVLLEWN